MKRKKLLLVTLTIGLLMALTPLAAIAAPGPSSSAQDEECDHPMALTLSNWMEGVSCEEIMEYHDAGVGFGVMMKAYYLSQVFPGLDWEDLVDRHMAEDGLGWGQVMKAYLLADVLGLDPEWLLEMHAQGMGWGEILQEQREGPGKPPWAGQGPPPWASQGPPPWSHGQGQGKPDHAGQGRPDHAGQGPPPWAQARGRPDHAGGPHNDED